MSGKKIMRMPRELDIELTAKCNLRCKYCYFFENENLEYTDLSTQEWTQFFDELGSIGVMKVTLAGGEPFFRSDLKELIDSVVKNRMRFALLSNGGLITDDIAAYIKKSGRCDSVQISLDGSCAAIHDIGRGKGSFVGAIRGLEILRKHDINTPVRFTIHHFNVDDLEDAAKFLLEDLGLKMFSTNSAGYFGNCRKNAEEIMLTHADRIKAMKTLVDLNKKYDGRISAAAGPLADAKYFGKMQKASDENAPPFKKGGHLMACGCYNNKLSIRCDGGISPCNMLPNINLGFINKDKIIDIWQNSIALNELRQREKIELSSFEFCKSCDFTDYCTGNCPGLAYNLTQKVNHPSPDACYRNFLEQTKSL
jgi:SynChlorMet cassette radical SAM/SPASM protein ScmE